MPEINRPKGGGIDISQTINEINQTDRVFKVLNIRDYRFTKQLEKAKNLPDMKKLFGAFVHTSELCLLGGKTGAGKTTLAYQLAFGIADGENVLNETNEAEPQKVLYLDFEHSLHNVKNRYQNLGAVSDNFFLLQTKDFIGFYRDVSIREINRPVDDFGPSVLILDNISALSAHTTQDPEIALTLIKSLKSLQNKNELTIIVACHTIKKRDGETLDKYDIAGSSNIHNFADSIVLLSETPQGNRYIKQAKARNAEQMREVLTCKINAANYLHLEPLGYEREDEIIKAFGAERSERSLKEQLEQAFERSGKSELRYAELKYQLKEVIGKSERTAERKIKSAKNNGLIIKIDEKYRINENENDDNQQHENDDNLPF